MTVRTLTILFLLFIWTPACGDPAMEQLDFPDEEVAEAGAEGTPEADDTLDEAASEEQGEDTDEPLGDFTGRLAGPISGVRYETPSVRGVTDENGTFRYNDGETVRFTMGDTVLGEAPGQPEVSAFDLADIAPLVTHRAIRGAVSDATHPFQKVINLTVFLQTMDYDGNANNGIQITPEVAALLDSNVSFEQAWDRFDHDPRFREALNAANEQDLLSEHRAVRLPALAMRHLYRAIGVEPQLFVLVEDVQTNLSGSVYIQTVEYDAEARRVWSEHVQVNGRESVVTTFEYDDDGQETTYRRTDGGEETRVRTSTHDPNGNKTHVRTTSRFLEPETHETRFEHDAFGNETLEETDLDDDGTPNLRRLTEWNPDGTKALDIRDDDADGNAELTCSYEYDPGGRVVRILKDVSADGGIDEVIALTYGPDGRLIRSTVEDAQGVLSEADHYFYDADGNLIRRERTDGDRHSVVRQTFDEAGDLVLVESNAYQDGFKPVRVVEYDAVGNAITRSSDFDADPDIERVTEYTYEPTTGWGFVFAAGRATSSIYCSAPIL